MPAIKHLLVISIAINAGLVLKLLHDNNGHEWATDGMNEVRVAKDVFHGVQNLSRATDQYINLDQ